MTKPVDPQLLEHFVAAWTAMFLAWAPFVDRKALEQVHLPTLLEDPEPLPKVASYLQRATATQAGIKFLVSCGLILLGPTGLQEHARIQAALKKYLEVQPPLAALLTLDSALECLLRQISTPQPLEVQPAEVAYKHVLSLLMAQCLPTPKPLDDDEDQ